MLDLISVGDTTLDTFLQLKKANLYCDLDKDRCQLCVNYAEKIPVESINQAVGGNAANVAVSGARLGLRTGLISIIGSDTSGKMILQTLKKEGVNTDRIIVDKGKKSNYSTILNLSGERTILIFHQKRDYCQLVNLPQAKMFYLTSMKDGWECMCEKGLLEYSQKNNIKIAYNPGTYQLKAGLESSQNLLKNTQILFLNKQEAQDWLQIDQPEVEILAKKFCQIGVKICVITDGKKGSFAYSQGRFYTQKAISGQIVETTGAGDAFASAFCCAYLKGLSIQESLLWGSLNAVSVISSIGAQQNLLTKSQLEDKLNSLKNN